ncbi:hypothetical protein AVEN_235876-1 [Araneus ventricosus]|uniref:Uncharacterized protein n=1 Tax=Araneus ventricosus TaxID=182803 RepID=A0A4Y2GHT0_ARAVE|nr:hypothetical protein AVEN_235876-1 [Araneus ventricosus]
MNIADLPDLLENHSDLCDFFDAEIQFNSSDDTFSKRLYANRLKPRKSSIGHFLVTPVVTKVLAAVRTLDRFGISDRAGAAIVSAALQDVGIISECNISNVVDRNKIRRGRTKARTTLLSQVIKDYDHDHLVYTSLGEKTGLYQWKTTEEKS